MITVTAGGNMTIEQFSAIVRRMIESCERDAAEFAAELAKNPARALGSAVSNFDRAAEYQVLMEIETMTQGGAALNDVGDHLFTSLLYGARYPSRSTSPAANLMHESRNGAIARLLDVYFRQS